MSTSSAIAQTSSPSAAIANKSLTLSGFFVSVYLVIVLFLLSLVLTGCGAGGYAGGGLTSISASTVTIDAGQSISISTQESGNEAVGWVLSGASCNAAACGTLSSSEGLNTTYTAPPGLSSPLQVTLTASLAGTQNKKVVSITINPDPMISGTPPPGTVGVAYSSTLTASGGTGALKWSVASGNPPAGLTFNTANGIISGTPTAVGTSVFTIQAVDASDVPFTVQARESITVSTTASALALTGNPPMGQVGTAYTTALGASGGVAPYTFSILSGSLPSGLALAPASGVISGTPTASGTSTFNAQVQDATGAKATGSFNINIVNGAGTLTLTASTLPNGTVGVPYSASIGVTGGTSPYTCVFTAGTLPAGLSLSGCLVSGTPTAATTANLTVKATDSANPAATGSGPESITIVAAPSLAISSPPGGTVGTPYTGTIPVSGGTAPYTCAITAGNLPAGLSLSGCVISGTPTVAGTSGLTIKATDSSNPATVTSGPITLVIAPAALSITTGTLPNGTVGVAYSSTIGVAGGTSPYTCSFTAGSLPAGLSLGANCLVSGTPTTSGTATLTVKATDSSNPTLTTSGPVSITIVAAPMLIISSPPSGTVGTPYNGTIPVSGGIAPYTCKLNSGTLEAGLTLGANCVITGTPTAPGSVSVVVQATDSKTPGTTTTGPVTVTINPSALAITTGTLPNGTVGVAYSSIIGVANGTAPYTCTITSGTLQAGLTLGPNCLVSGTPTVSGTVSLGVKATDSSNPTLTANGTVGLTINPAPATLTPGNPPPGVIGQPYMGTIPVTGGTGPYKCTLQGGALPAGLTLSANCTITGTPTGGTASPIIGVIDSGNPPATGSGPVTVTINPALAITTGTLPNGTVGVAYSATIGVANGTSPYTCTITSGTLQAGLTLGPNCLVSGTPTVSGTVSLGVKATDSSNPTLTANGTVGLTINPAPATLTPGNPPPGVIGQPYMGTIPVTGGTGPYKCTLQGGALPAGLTLSANCTITGTPTGGTASPIIGVIDSGNPPATGSGPVTVTINPALAITTGTLPNGTVGVAYSATIVVANGTAPYTCTITSGTLQAGLTLGPNCLVSGTPTVSGTVSLGVKATDSSNPTLTANGTVGLTINPAPLAITTGTLPNGTVGIAYSSTIGVTGGTSPYACSITSGTLPAGLALGANCLVSGTPTVATTANLTVKATDSSNPTLTTSGPVSITIVAAPVTLTPGNPPAGTVGVPYTGVIPVSGGTAPYTCTLTSGTVPAGLTLTNCTLTGTPTTPGSSPIVLSLGDSSNPPATGSGTVTITINPAPVVLTLGNPPAATVGVPYTGVIPVTGGTGPYTCKLNSGTVPAGLTLTNCTLTGTPTTPGSPILNITATDSSSPVNTTTGNVTVTINGIPLLTLTGSLPNGIVGVPYTQTLHAAGGVAPYTYALTAGSLPAGLALSTAGVISGTPTTVGASSFTVTATDTEPTPQTASLPLVLLITYPVTPADSELKGPYAFLFQGYDDHLIGVLAYQTATVGSFTADGAGGIANGELDANHQTSNPANATVASNLFLGTYTLGTDNRGSLTLTTLNPDGTTAQTTTYAIAVKAPVAPATTTAQGSLIEFDGDQIRGTKGSGSLLQQTAASFTTGLTGSYAFGLGGDTPCLPTCAVGIVAGPVASVGQFTVNAGTITSGASDANIANIKYTNQPLSGSYGTADGNGRVQLSLATAGTPVGIYPTDYAVYMVNANQAFILSTDKHSAAILLAGSAQSQTSAPFTGASLSGPFVGYENAATNPGLVGATLANVTNLSTATIFRATSDSAGTCNVTDVDTGGTTQLVNGLTGLGSGAPIINALLGTYQSTGPAACTISSNGRGILNYPVPGTILSGTLGLLGLGNTPPPARVVYLANTDRGYFLETGYAGLGQIEPQTGVVNGFKTFNGTYLYGEAPASSAATINGSGFITANGAGAATSTEDLNVGVGTLNVLQLGVTHNETYTAPDGSGRFLLNDTTVVDTSVVYVLSPGRFVLLDTNPLTTSPSINILY